MNYLSSGEIWESIKKDFPEVKELSDIVSDGSKIVSTINKIREKIVRKKIKVFFENLSKTSDKEIGEYLKSLEDDISKKTFFIETLNKVVDLDDDFQIYILTLLVKKFNINKKLNYWEKSLYYNIKSLSKDDFLTFYNFLDALEKPIQHKVSYGTPKNNNDELDISIKKLETIGIINLYTGTFAAECSNLYNKNEYSLAFSFYPYVDELYEMIGSFIKDKNIQT